LSKKKRQRLVPASKRKSTQASSSLAIPIIVGLVVIAVIVGAILSIETQRRPGTAVAASNTAAPLATSSIPYPNVPRISVQEAKDRLDKGEIVLVDVRSKGSYDKAHAVGALSIPETEIEARLDELTGAKASTDRPLIVLYCT
jgi:hypothetical protein